MAVADRPIVLPACSRLSVRKSGSRGTLLNAARPPTGAEPFPAATLLRIYGLLLKIPQNWKPDTNKSHSRSCSGVQYIMGIHQGALPERVAPHATSLTEQHRAHSHTRMSASLRRGSNPQMYQSTSRIWSICSYLSPTRRKKEGQVFASSIC